MEINGFSRICKVNELKEGEGKRFIILDEDIALFKTDGKVFALNNICPHKHVPSIYNGFIEEGYVICPSHGWEFNLADGKMKTGKNGLTVYEVQIKDDFVFVKVNKKNCNW